MATAIWVNTGSSNALMSDGKKPLPKLKVTYHQRCHLTAISQETLINLTFKYVLILYFYNYYGIFQGAMSETILLSGHCARKCKQDVRDV